MRKYGMRFRTIRYWQSRAQDLWRYNGIRAVGFFDLFTDAQLVKADPRMLAHDAIMLAYVHGNDAARRLLIWGTLYRSLDGKQL